MHPELGFEETETSKFIISKLEELNLPFQKVAKTGIVATFDSGKTGPLVALRADMDALPIQEENPVEYCSTVAGKMHACGHDGHTAILLGLAKTLVENKDSAKGKVLLIFQPAEEKPPGGALGIIESGMLEGVEAIVGLHISPEVPYGAIGTRPGPFMSAVSEFVIEITGRGGHASRPQKCVDPIVVGSYLVTNLQTIVSRLVDPIQSAVVTVASFHAGSTFNVIPERALLTGTIRTLSENTADTIEDSLRRITEGTCQAHGAIPTKMEISGHYPVLVNHPQLTNELIAAAKEKFGEDKVFMINPSMGAEDFAYYGNFCPATFFFLGAADKSRDFTTSLHNPRFDFPEEIMLNGVKLFLTVLQAKGIFD